MKINKKVSVKRPLKRLFEGSKNSVKGNIESADEIEQKADNIVDSLNNDVVELEDLGDFNEGDDALASFDQTDLPSFNFKVFYMLVNLSYNTKKPLLVYGDPGLGKSAVVINQAKQIARSRNREFVNWNDTNQEEKEKLIASPEKYFSLIDVRVNKLEPMDFIGIPDIRGDKPYLETKQFSWIHYLSKPDSDGILFLDEINQGSPETLRALFEVVLDKKFGGTKMSDNVAIIGAGNLGSDYEQPIPRALINRFSCGVVTPDMESWLEWAEKAKIDRRIISFVKSDPKGEVFYKKPANESDAFPTPRSIHVTSDQMKHLTKSYAKSISEGKMPDVSIYKAIASVAASNCGVSWARQFLVFLKYLRKYNMKDIVADLGSLKKATADKLHALTLFLLGRINRSTNIIIKNPKEGQTSEEVRETLEGTAKVMLNLKKEWNLTLWNLLVRDLEPVRLKTALEYWRHGNYDSSTKNDMLTKLVPMISSLIKKYD